MIIMLFVGLVALIVGACCIINNWCNDRAFGIAIGLLMILIISPGIFAPIITSYTTYLDIKSFYVGVEEQYRSAIEMYEEKAIIDVDKAFTDLKYQGYQEQIANFIVSLREKIADYNYMYIQKKIMDDNPLFSWYIIAPDSSMKLLSLKEK